MKRELTCIVCPKGCKLTVTGEEELSVSGNGCPRGAAYGEQEVRCPVRTVTSTIEVLGGLHPRLPVKTSQAIEKAKIEACMALIDTLSVKAPVGVNTVIARNILGTEVAIVATRDMPSA